MICTTDYSGSLLFIFENGKAAKVPLSAYATKTNRKKLANAYSDKSPLVKLLFLPEDTDVFIRSSGNRGVLVHTSEIAEKTTRSTQGVQVMTLKGKHIVAAAELPEGERLEAIQSFRVKSIPAAGKLTKDLEEANQMSLL